MAMLRQCCYFGRRRAERRKEWTRQSVALSRAKERVLWGARSKARAPYDANFRPRRRERREALRADKRQRRAAFDAKMIWTGGLPHLSGLPHLPGVPHLHVKQALILVWKLLSAKVPKIYPRSLKLQKMTVNANSTQRSQLSCWAQPESLLPRHQNHNEAKLSRSWKCIIT